MNTPHENAMPSGMKQALCLAAVESGSLLVYVLAAYTGRMPDGGLAFAATRHVVLRAMAAPAFVAVLLAGVALVLRLTGADRPVLRAARVMLPSTLLLVLPVVVFVLHPLGVPPWIGALATSGLLIPLAAALSAMLFIVEVRETSFGQTAAGRFNRLPSWVTGSLVFVLASGFYLTASLQDDRWRGLVGDEPHYLLLTESLQRHHTSNQAAALRDPRVPPEISCIKPHRAARSPYGKIYSVHHIGLPVLLVLPHALLGYRGVLLFFNLAAGLVALNIFLLTHSVTGRRALAAGVALLMAATVPLAFYFRCVYPDLIAALFAVYAYRVFREGSGTAGWRFCLAVGMAAFLPWLHVKYLILSACLGASYLAAGGWKAWRRLPVMAVIYAISGAAMMIYFSSTLGTWKPTAQYHESHAAISPFLFRGAAGLFWDRDHGLLAYSPYVLLAAAGLWPLWRDRRREAAGLLFIILPTFVIVSSHWMWWGGPCPAGRFLLPILPFMAPFVAAGFGTLRTFSLRAAAAVPVVFALVVAAASLADPVMLAFHHHIGYRLFPALDGYPALPTFFIHRSKNVPASSWTFLAWWMLPAVCLAVWGVLARRQHATRPGSDVACILRGTAFAGLLVLLPGVYSIAYNRQAGNDPQVIDANRRLAQLNLPLALLFQPLHQARADTADFISRLPITYSKTVKLTKKASGTFAEDRTGGPLWILNGPYTVLYPVSYRMQFNVTATGPAGREIGLVSVDTDQGLVNLAQKAVIAQEGEQVISIDIHPGKIEKEVEFRTCLTAPGRIKVDSVAVTVMAAGPSQTSTGAEAPH
jgi:hypothetical protein